MYCVNVFCAFWPLFYMQCTLVHAELTTRTNMVAVTYLVSRPQA